MNVKKGIQGFFKQTLKEGFEKHVIRNDKGCWDWKGSVQRYGQMSYDYKKITAHRASWIIHFGEIPEGMYVCHKCDNTKCSNPEHLFLGTAKDNIQDCINKKRIKGYARRGEKNSKCKLKEVDVLEIKKLLKTNITQDEIAKKFNVTQVAISKIKCNKNWRSI